MICSVNTPCATVQIEEGMPEASSNRYISPYWLCAPANASGFSSDHSWAAMYQYFGSIFMSRATASRSHAAGSILVAATSNQWLLTAIVTHLAISGNVLVLSCGSPFAVTQAELPSRVVHNQCANQAKVADLPMPRPEATAALYIAGTALWIY